MSGSYGNSRQQDEWGPTILTKKAPKSDAAKKTAPSFDPTKKIIEEEFPDIKRVNHSVSTAIMQARQALGIKQKELATKINEKEQIVHEYESGTATPNPQVLAKMERILGVKLRGENIGEKLVAKHLQNKSK